jgi:large subunit ribosomal protein L17
MRHNVKGRKLGRTTEHRLSLFRNQLASLVEAGRIVTTLPKAKELRPLAERLVTKGKRGTVEARRLAGRWIPRRDLIKKLFDEVAPRFQTREGGYLRILKLGPRSGDGAEMAVLQWVDYEPAGAEKKKGGAKKGAKAGEKGEKGEKAAKGKAGKGEEGEEKAPAKKKTAARKPGGAKKPAGNRPKPPRATAKPTAGKAKTRTPRKAGGE